MPYIIILVDSIAINLFNEWYKKLICSYVNVGKNYTPWFVVDDEHCIRFNGMPCCCQDSNMHTVTRYDRRWNID